MAGEIHSSVTTIDWFRPAASNLDHYTGSADESATTLERRTQA